MPVRRLNHLPEGQETPGAGVRNISCLPRSSNNQGCASQHPRAVRSARDEGADQGEAAPTPRLGVFGRRKTSSRWSLRLVPAPDLPSRQYHGLLGKLLCSWPCQLQNRPREAAWEQLSRCSRGQDLPSSSEEPTSSPLRPGNPSKPCRPIVGGPQPLLTPPNQSQAPSLPFLCRELLKNNKTKQKPPASTPKFC